MPTRNEYLRALECVKYVVKFVKKIENPSTGTSFKMLDKNGEIIMEADIAYWEDGNADLKRYLRRKINAID